MQNIKEKTHADLQKEREYIRRFKEGDLPAFSHLVNLYQKRVFKLAFGFFQDKDDAMEIVQETFLRVYEKIDKFDIDSSFNNWIYRIAYNLCIDYYRKFKSKTSYQREVFEHNETQNPEPEEPEHRIDREKFQAGLKASLDELSGRQKMIFVMKHHNGLKYKEIADILSISIGTVKSLHHRAAKALQKKLAHFQYEVAK